jgi:polar amino acid transport system substrate-binding protein
VRADSELRTMADVDRAGLTIGAARGASQQVYVRATVKNARVVVMPEVPAHDALARMLIGGEIDAFAANRTRMEELARTSPQVRVLPDNFLPIGQAIVVDKGRRAQVEQLNRFLADLREIGFVKTSLERAGLVGVEPASAPASDLNR